MNFAGGGGAELFFLVGRWEFMEDAVWERIVWS